MGARGWKIGLAGVLTFGVAVATFGPGIAQQSNTPEKTNADQARAKPEKGDSRQATDANDGATERPEDDAAIRKTAERFVTAFNAGDAKGAAEQFLPKSEYLNSDGEAFSGRAAIEQDLAAFFKEFPKARIELTIDSIRFVGPRVAIEEGRTAVTHQPGGVPVRQSYLSIDLLTDGEWKLASVRETLDDEPATPREHLEELAWLVGEWVDESDAGVASTHCRWSDDGNYLLTDFELRIAGRKAVSGQQRIGWDPLTRQFKSWMFDSQGGYSEGLWAQDGERWVVKARGVRSDGTVATATQSFTPRGPDAYLFDSTDRTVGDSFEDDVHVVVVRRPPAPGVKTRAKADAQKPDASKTGSSKPDKSKPGAASSKAP